MSITRFVKKYNKMSDLTLYIIISLLSVFIIAYVWLVLLRGAINGPEKRNITKHKKTSSSRAVGSKFVKEGFEERIRRRLKK